MSTLTDMEHWQLIRRRALEEAAVAAEAEVVEEVGPGDDAYNRAIQDAAAAVRALSYSTVFPVTAIFCGFIPTGGSRLRTNSWQRSTCKSPEARSRNSAVVRACNLATMQSPQ